MNKIAAIMLLSLLLVETAIADQFQFLHHDTASGGTYYVSYSEVTVFLDGKKWTFYTDKFGRITMNLSRGSYSVRVYYRDRSWGPFKVQIDGKKGLKKISF